MKCPLHWKVSEESIHDYNGIFRTDLEQLEIPLNANYNECSMVMCRYKETFWTELEAMTRRMCTEWICRRCFPNGKPSKCKKCGKDKTPFVCDWHHAMEFCQECFIAQSYGLNLEEMRQIHSFTDK